MLISHIHTGHLVKHHQTSYAVLALIAVLLGVFLLGITSVVKAGNTEFQSGAINVFATVPGIPPAAIPVITSPIMGDKFDKIPISVSGTCLSGLIVKVFRSGVFSGAVMCQNGTFNVLMDLFDGTNHLTAKHFNSIDQGGPASSVVTVYYNRNIITPTPTTSPGTYPTSNPTITPQYISQLVLMSDTAYHGLFLGEEIKWPAEVKDGLAPYAISWDWGDGTVDLISQKEAGTFTVAHGYKKPGQYKIVINATDLRGETAHLELIMVVHESLGAAAGSQPVSWLDHAIPIVWPIYASTSLLVISFWLGEIRAKRMLISELATGKMV